MHVVAQEDAVQMLSDQSIPLPRAGWAYVHFDSKALRPAIKLLRARDRPFRVVTLVCGRCGLCLFVHVYFFFQFCFAFGWRVGVRMWEVCAGGRGGSGQLDPPVLRKVKHGFKNFRLISKT